MKKINFIKNKEKGFALLVAITTTSILLLISFIVVDVAVKQLTLNKSGRLAERAFYAADSGAECAFYWDIKGNADGQSLFSSVPVTTQKCNGEPLIIAAGLPVTENNASGGPTNYITYSFSLGGNGASETSTSVCAKVTVKKGSDETTVIESRGYNTCVLLAPDRFERGVHLGY